jgi:uncharacterized membrane protein YphA (DoxX/SURF4 family)
MSGSAKRRVGRADIANAVVRMMLAALMMVHAGGQLVAFWRASQIINPRGFPDAVMMANSAVPILLLMMAIALAIGLTTRATALALMLIIAIASVIDLLLLGTAVAVPDWLPRLAVMIGLLSPFMTGGGRLSVDGLLESRLALSFAQSCS